MAQGLVRAGVRLGALRHDQKCLLPPLAKPVGTCFRLHLKALGLPVLQEDVEAGVRRVAPEAEGVAFQGGLGSLRGVARLGVELQQRRRGAELAVVGHRRPSGPGCGCRVGDGHAVEPDLVEAADLASMLEPEVAELVGLENKALEHGGGASKLEAVNQPHGLMERRGVRLRRDAWENLKEAVGQSTLLHVLLDLEEVRKEARLHHQQHAVALQEHVHRVLQTKEREVGGRHHQALLSIAHAVDLKLEVFLGLRQRGAVRLQREGHESRHLRELPLGVGHGLGPPGRQERDVVAALAEVLLPQEHLELLAELLGLLHTRLLLAALAD
mmetsp:Transcript_95213/g.252895  ORF Transcript_95213/g.252895 Transcript_95213/m.252895 type:complete len:327 (-) Transcript_95213:184-1164(-)